MDFKSILLAQKTGYIPRNHFDALFARKAGGAVLKDFPGLPASIVTVTDAIAKPLNSLKVAITPVQSGSGDPSPDNIRPISGWTECNVVVSPTTDAEDGTTYTITFHSEAGTVYGGTLDVVNGVLTVDRVIITLTGREKKWEIVKASSGTYPFIYLPVSNSRLYINDLADQLVSLFSHFKTANVVSSNNERGARVFFSTSATPNEQRIIFRPYPMVTLSEFKSYLEEQYDAGTPVQCCPKLYTPRTYQLTPTEVQMLLGTNNIWADTGEILEGKYWGKKSSKTRAMLNTTRSAVTEEPSEETPEEPEENADER